jgi:thiol-disulfide isomerase/thioredoxin
VLTLATLAVRAADDTKAQDPDTMWGELVEKATAEESPKARRALFDTYSRKFLASAEKHPKSKTAVRALSYVLQLPDNDAKDSPQQKAIATLKKDYVENKDASKAARAHAAKALLKDRTRTLDLARRVKDDDDTRAEYVKDKGKKAAEKLIASMEATEKEVKGYVALLKGELRGIFPELGRPAPEVVSQDLNGKKVKLSDLRGKVVVLDIWATWCPPCRRMIPHTRKLVEKMKDRPFVFVSISVDAKKETVVDFKKENSMPWTHWWNGLGGIVNDWDVEGYPTIYVLDTKGVIRARIDEADNEAVEKAVEQVMKETKKTRGKTE